MKIYSLKNLFILTILAGIVSAGFHGLNLFGIFPTHVVYSDILAFFQRAHAPGFPYVDKNIEYPVITGMFIQLMSYLGTTQKWYFIFSSLFLILSAALTTYFLHKMVPAENKKRLLSYWIFAPTFLLFLTYNWDILAVFFSVAALYFYQKENHTTAAFSLALGFSSKLYPAFFLIPLLLKIRGGYERLNAFLVFIAAAGAINAYFIWKNFSGWYYFFALNQTRNSNPDSIWTTVRFLSGGMNISTINAISLFLFIAGSAIIIWKMRNRTIIELCFAFILLFLLVNKVFTPQYILWLLPFFVLMPAIKKITFYALEFSNAAVLFTILPWFFFGHDIFYFFLSAPFVVTRHIILIYMLFVMLRTKNPLQQNNRLQ